MKNIEVCPSESYKAGTLGGEILQKIHQIGCKTYETKRMEGLFYDQLSEKATKKWDKDKDDRLRKIAHDNFSERWKEIDEGRDEVGRMISALYFLVECEEGQRIRKIEKKWRLER